MLRFAGYYDREMHDPSRRHPRLRAHRRARVRPDRSRRSASASSSCATARPRETATRSIRVPHTPLNDTGEGQAALAAKALATTRIGKLVASPMARAWRTASLIAAEHQMHPEATARCRALLCQPLGHADRGRVQLGLGPGRLRAARDLRAPRRAEPAAHPRRRQPRRRDRHRGARRRPAGRLRAHPGDARNSHRRNAVPLRFARENGTWTATPL